MNPGQDDTAVLINAVTSARQQRTFLADLSTTLVHASDQLSEAQQRCQACGKCCNFRQADHRLFVTTGELALLSVSPAVNQPTRLLCPYQVNGQCTARDRRPLGCRMYICYRDLQSKGQSLYNHYHARIQALHERYDVAYYYLELSAGLMALDESCE